MTLKLGLMLTVCGYFLWAQPANQVGIAHVAFRVSDLDAARAFYGKLGFEQFFEMKSGDKTTEAFLKVNDHQFIELYPQTAPAQALGLMHVCYESNDLEALHAQLASRGLAVSDVRKAGAGNLLMTLKDLEGQTIEYTQYMPGSRHYEDRGQHLGAKRVSQIMLGATSVARDTANMEAFYTQKLGFSAFGGGSPVRLRMPGDSGQEVDLVPQGAGGVQFGIFDRKETEAALAALGLHGKEAAAGLVVSDPDGAAVTFVAINGGKAGR